MAKRNRRTFTAPWRRDMSTPRRCVLVDLDGTIAWPTERNVFDMRRVDSDGVDAPLVEMLRALRGVDIVVVTGRNEAGREGTERWLHQNNLEAAAMFMRPDGDRRSNISWKEHVLHTCVLPSWSPLCAFEDDERVAQMYRRNGLCVAVVAEINNDQ